MNNSEQKKEDTFFSTALFGNTLVEVCVCVYVVCNVLVVCSVVFGKN